MSSIEYPDYNEVKAELEAAAAQDVAADSGQQAAPAPASPAPEGQTSTPDVQPAPAQPEPTPAPAPAPEDTFDGGQFNPDTLPAELQPAWRQLQGAFTKRTQEVAEQRKQFEALGGVDAVQQAVDLYTRINDPSNWQQLHAELTAALQEQGLAPAAPEPVAPLAPAPDDDLDPELAPLVAQLRTMEARFAQMEAANQAQVQSQEAERQYAQMVNEAQAQLGVIREANPHYTDVDVDAIIELSSFHNGDLAAAQGRYEAIVEARLARYFAGKQSAASETSTTPPAGAGVAADTVSAAQTLQEVGEEAAEYFRGLVASGELEF